MWARSACRRALFWILLGVMLWGLSAGALSAWAWHTPRDHVRVQSGGTTFAAEDIAALERALAKHFEGGRVAGFSQQLRATAHATQTAASQAVDVLWVCGEAPPVMALSLLEGTLPVAGDAQGCALSAGTARALFGSTDVLGKALSLGGTALFVRGVFEGPQGALAFLTDPGRALLLAPYAAAPADTGISALTVLPAPVSGQSPVQTTGEAIRRAGIYAAGTVTDHADTRALLHLAAGMPALFCVMLAMIAAASRAIAICCRYYALGMRLRADRLTPGSAYRRLFLRCAGMLAGILALCALALWIFPGIPAIPPGYLPTAWSDFAFWPALLRRAMQSAVDQRLVGVLRPDMARNTLTVFCAVLPLLAAVFLWHGHARLQKAWSGVTLPTAMLLVLPLMAALLLGGWLTGAVGWPPTASLYMVQLPLLPILIQALAGLAVRQEG